MAYRFINFLFLFLSHISFIFSFSYLVFTASISALPYFFFFSLLFCSILFPFMNMSHHRFPLYHHWSIKSPSMVFFPLLFALSSLFRLKVAYRRGSLGCGSLFSILYWAADSLFVVGLGCGGFVCVCFAWCFARRHDGLWVCDFGLWSVWVFGLWVWVVVGLCVCFAWCFGHQRDGFASLSFFFLLSSHRSGFCDCLISSRRSGFCDCDGGCFVIWKRKAVGGPLFFFFVCVCGGFWLVLVVL